MSGSGKTVFVTGGGGYVASHSIIEFLKEDFNVVAVDNFVNSIRGAHPYNNNAIHRVFLDHPVVANKAS